MDQYMKTPTFEVICQLGKHGVVRVESRLRKISLFWVQHHCWSDTSSLQGSPGVGFQPGVQKHLKGLQQAQITVAVKQQHTSETKVQFQVPRFWSCSIFWSLEEAGLRSCLDDGRRNTEHGLLRWRWRSGHYSARAAPRPGNHLF